MTQKMGESKYNMHLEVAWGCGQKRTVRIKECRERKQKERKLHNKEKKSLHLSIEKDTGFSSRKQTSFDC